MDVAVGIDLGTTNSCAAVVQADEARVVKDEAGRNIQPSVISFLPDGEMLSGYPAKERQIVDSQNTIYSFKRLIGRDLSTPEMQEVLKRLSYEVCVDPVQKIPAVRVPPSREVSLPEISAMMLQHMRKMCESNLGVTVKDAVITVPANFNDVQRSSTKVAGRIAGFNVLRILNEPTAAALAYGLGGGLSERIGVFDFGGGTFDITVVELSDDIYEVLSTAGDTFLGGDDFDRLLSEMMRKQFLDEYEIDLSGDRMAMQRIRVVAEKIKCQLSSLNEVQATLREIAFGPDGQGIDFNFRILRDRFEKIVEPLIDRSLKVCDEALKLAKVDRLSLDNLILVGGTTRIPMVRQRVAEYFGKEPRVEINPDEVVAIGAAIHGFSLTGKQLPAILPTKEPEAAAKIDSVDSKVVPEIRTDIPVVSSFMEPASQERPLPGPESSEQPEEVPKSKDDGTLLGMVSLPDADVAVQPVAPKGAVTPSQEQKATRRMKPSEEVEEEKKGEEAKEPEAKVETQVQAQAPQPEVSEQPEKRRTTGRRFSLPDLSHLIPKKASKPPVAATADEGLGGPIEEESVSSAELPPLPTPTEDKLPPLVFDDEVKGDGFGPKIKADIASSVSVGGKTKSTLLLDVTPRALGVATTGGFCEHLIERNSSIPVEQSQRFTTSTDNQTEVSIEVCQGESRRMEENVRLGRVLLADLRPAPRGSVKILVTFEIDTDGILRVSARNEETGQAQQTRIVLTGGLNDEAVEDLVKRYAD